MWNESDLWICKKVWLSPFDSKSVELSPLFSQFAFSKDYPGKYQVFLLWEQKGKEYYHVDNPVFNDQINISKLSSTGISKSHSSFNLLDAVQWSQSYLFIKKLKKKIQQSQTQKVF